MATPRDVAKQFVTAAIGNCDSEGAERDILGVPRDAVFEEALASDNAAGFMLDVMTCIAYFAGSLANWAAHASECMTAAETWALMVESDSEEVA